MKSDTALIEENKLLKSKLALAEKWMQREVASSIYSIQKINTKKTTRRHFDNVFETEGLDIITEKILAQFADIIPKCPPHTLERLIDAEIYWKTLQQYPHMDALPVILAYQKILESIFEYRIVEPFRLAHTHTSTRTGEKGLDIDIARIISHGYRLSLGRWYGFLELVRTRSSFSGVYEGLFFLYLSEQKKGIFDVLISDDFFLAFGRLVDMEVFSLKRHDAKVSYSDAETVRDILLGDTHRRGLFEMFF